MVRRQRRNANRLMTRFRRSERRLEDGFPIKGKADPPSYTSAPWWPLTVFIPTFAKTDITPSTISAAIEKQLPTLSVASGYALRVQALRCWVRDNPISLKINNPINSITIGEIVDYPAPRNFAHLGWKYGRVHSELPLDISSANVLFTVNTHNNSANVKTMVYVNVLLRFYASETVVKPADVCVESVIGHDCSRRCDF